ncbi:thioesterase II family protein [Paenibacillus sp. sgz5001063]|uniref:thioesterase II family protein n=1 Tax=Paenibacillus sp. sgz5001063 TaxID=3242474 RepID=UPI0036D2B66E
MQPIKLLCLPYAGGSAMVFSKWRTFIHPSIELLPVELAGRGSRFKEALYTDFDTAVEDIYEQIKDEIAEGPYALFGHSMGSWLAYEVYHAIRRRGGELPLHLFVSGRQAPQLESETEYSSMDDSNFIGALRDYGGTSEDVLDNPDVLKVFLPILKSDFQITENYKYQQNQASVTCGLTVLTGRNDNHIRFRDLLPWKELGNASSHIYEMRGGHFFITEYPEEVSKLINQILLSCLEGSH